MGDKASHPVHACESCGRYDAVQVGERWLCIDCYAGAGSCCPEFGKDDLWPKDDPCSTRPIRSRRTEEAPD